MIYTVALLYFFEVFERVVGVPLKYHNWKPYVAMGRILIPYKRHFCIGNSLQCYDLAKQLSQYLFLFSFSLVILGCMRYMLGLGLVLCISSSVNLTRTPSSSPCQLR